MTKTPHRAELTVPLRTMSAGRHISQNLTRMNSHRGATRTVEPIATEDQTFLVHKSPGNADDNHENPNHPLQVDELRIEVQ